MLSNPGTIKGVPPLLGGMGVSGQKGSGAEEKACKALALFRDKGTFFWGGRTINNFSPLLLRDSRRQSGVGIEVSFNCPGRQELETLLLRVKPYWNMGEQQNCGRSGVCFVGIWPNDFDARYRVGVALSGYLRICDFKRTTEEARSDLFPVEISWRQKLNPARWIARILSVFASRENRQIVLGKATCNECKKDSYTVVNQKTITCLGCGKKIIKKR